MEWTHHSNAIEGNTLSLQETKLVLEEGLTIGGKTLREHFEAINHGEAISYVEGTVQRHISLSENVIKDLHAIILKNIDDKNAGKYRQINVRISGSEHGPVNFLKVPEQMSEMMVWYQELQNKIHPAQLASELHFKFVSIHPFVDGNGRTARLLLNLILMQNGYPPVILKSSSEKKLAYYEALEEASVNGNMNRFNQLIYEELKESLTRYINAVE